MKNTAEVRPVSPLPVKNLLKSSYKKALRNSATLCFFLQQSELRKPKAACAAGFFERVCVISSADPICFLSDGRMLIVLYHLFCLQAEKGFDPPSRQHSGSVALSARISSRRLSHWKTPVIWNLKSGLTIVYRTQPLPLDFFSLLPLPHCLIWFQFISFRTYFSFSAGEWPDFNEIHL